MEYIFAFDGGGTKTRMIIVDLNGNIIFNKVTTGCNIFSIGDLQFQNIIKKLYIMGKKETNIKEKNIVHIFLGLSGADLKSDYQRLNDACRPIFGLVKYTIINDAWIILRSGLKKAYGAVCICGTGTNSAALNRNGEKAILRSLSFTLGTYGSGLDIAREALHYAFRADELTYRDTLLRLEIPKLLNTNNIEDVIPLFYPRRIIDRQLFGSITGLVSDCALKGDVVANMILKKAAKSIALQTLGVMKQVKIENDRVPVVIGGRVFQIEASIFLETFIKVLLNKAKKAYIVKPKFIPVVGAYLFVLDKLGIQQTDEIEENLIRSGGKL